MTPRQQIEFRSLQGALLEIVMKGSDPHALLQHTERTEKWIDNLVDKAVTEAVKPFVNIDISSNKGTATIKKIGE